MAAVSGAASAQKFDMTKLNTQDKQGMVTKLEQMVAEANERIKQLQTEIDFETFDYPVELVKEIGIDLIKKATTVSTDQLGKIVDSKLKFWDTDWGSEALASEMPSSFVKAFDVQGNPGFAVRCARVDQYDPNLAKVVSIFQTKQKELWAPLHSTGYEPYNYKISWKDRGGVIDDVVEVKADSTRHLRPNFKQFAELASGKVVVGVDCKQWKMI